MTALRPCSACKRHVRASATACPFCDATLAPGRAQYVKPSAFARAAVFSAALAGCKDHKPPAPKPVPAQQGSDDLENMLDQQARTADHPVTAPIDAAVQVAAPEDAAVDKNQQTDAKKKRLEEIRQRRHEVDTDAHIHERVIHEHINAKPYGAPPARRRVV